MQYDLVIVGGGLVGAGLAAALADANLRIALVDAKLPSNNDPRLFALNHTSCQFLKNVKVWAALQEHAASIEQVHVSNQGHFGAVRLNHHDVNLPELGFVIPAYIIETALNERLLTLANVTLYRPATLQSLTQDNNGATLTIATDEKEIKINATIVIGADGVDSTVRKELTIPTDTFDYQQSALVTRTMLHRSHHHIAYERFNKTGAIAMLPLVGNECATIWSADQQTINELMSLSDAAFLQALQKEFGHRLGRFTGIKPRFVYPLKMLRAEKAVDQHVILLGNALHSLHPIAAQGFNLALFEVAVFVEAVLQAKENLHELNLQKISDEIAAQQSKSIGVSHRLPQLFAAKAAWQQSLVQFGMIGLDLLVPLKRKFIDGMMGRAGRVPPLLTDGISYEQQSRSEN